ncbi:MAG TPA: ATP-dependent DNA helicase [Nevskiaceae bacterium]|nr:ATP-dependent DNA helicase [Nevskiaceae bacterium]
MGAYNEVLAGLNAQQKQAVEHIDGPVLVIAGPGTGKTQLLGVRVAHILQVTDTLPQNILCLTFTENGAENMRERLTRFIGRAAYDVNISTYHAFGGDLIRRFPEVFAETRAENPADELTKRQILREIIEGLSYHNPIKQSRHHLGDLISTISEVKRALLTDKDLRAIAAENAGFITAANQAVQTIFKDFTTMPRKVELAKPPFEQLLDSLQGLIPDTPANPRFGSLARIAMFELAEAIQAADDTNKTNTLTKWKNTWLAKNTDNKFIFDGALQNQRIQALADVLERYQAQLAEHGWYDFDDMIIRAIAALEQHADLRYSLQEQYLYILLDEFQDTNAAQLRLVQLLSDNPVHEGRPNVLAVGDDNQAIYAFQGAQYSNMFDFYQMYRDVAVISLTENYRSTPDILLAAGNIATQIEGKLEQHFETDQHIQRTLQSANTTLPKITLERREFLSDVAQYDWIAHEIKELIDKGTAPSEIAVLAPKHKQLEPLVPYLADLGVPMRYEKRENILEAPVVRQLLAMSKLVLAINAQNDGLANALWPEVLSFEFWNIPVSELWRLSWKINDDRTAWSNVLLGSDKTHFREPALLLLGLAGRVDTDTCEHLLDYLIGTEELVTHEPTIPAVRSPLRAFYTGPDVQHTNPELFYDTISHLTVLRAKLRSYEATRQGAISLRDLIAFVNMYQAADERLLNTSPYNQQADAVQLMTVFKAKGLEWQHVFLPSCQDDVWGASARGNSNKLTLPANLTPVRHAGATDDERLRILFVALTRAKFGLHLTSFARTFAGKTTKHLKYLDEAEQTDGSFKSLVLPEHAQTVIPSDHTAPTLASLELNWRQRHVNSRNVTKLKGLLGNRLAKYQLSPTHLTGFIDLQYGGPDEFFFNTLLRFPQAPTADSQFGSAMHDTLEWLQHRTDQQGSVPTIADTIKQFGLRLQTYKLTPTQTALEQERGEKALSAYLAARSHIFKAGDKAEHNFRNENVFVNNVHMAGKVDRMEIDHKAKTITVVDYKTGKSFARWTSDPKLHKYQLQLYCYKLLIDNSRTYRGYQVERGRLEFIEPDTDNRIHTLELTFKDEQITHTKQLLQAVWQHIQHLDFPDISSYDTTLTAIKQFEADLINTYIG